MKLNRLEFIKELEAKHEAEAVRIAEAKAKAQTATDTYEAEKKKYATAIAELVKDGKCEIDTLNYGRGISITFDKNVSLPSMPVLSRVADWSNNLYTNGYGYGYINHNREKLLTTLRLSNEEEISITKQILDMM
jgi:hypothetical protein